MRKNPETSPSHFAELTIRVPEPPHDDVGNERAVEERPEKGAIASLDSVGTEANVVASRRYCMVSPASSSATVGGGDAPAW